MDILGQKQVATLPTKLGDIEVRTPSTRQKLEIEKRRSFYAGGLTVLSQDGAELADIFATLDVMMTKCPSMSRVKGDETSWDYDAVYDEDALRDAFDEVIKWQNSFRKPVERTKEEVGQA